MSALLHAIIYTTTHNTTFTPVHIARRYTLWRTKKNPRKVLSNREIEFEASFDRKESYIKAEGGRKSTKNPTEARKAEKWGSTESNEFSGYVYFYGSDESKFRVLLFTRFEIVKEKNTHTQEKIREQDKFEL